MKILLVDDDPLALKILTRFLNQQGHEVVEANDGEVAWQMVLDHKISFVVSDWMMPRLAGVDLCRRIRATDFGHYVYVILCTAKGGKSDLIEGMDAGADDFLVKPISPEELRVKVRAGERVLSLQAGLAQKNRELAGINTRLQAAQKVLEDDLKAAAWMQEQLLPSASLQAHGLRCEWRLQPSGYVAGDIFNFFALNEEQIGFYLLDVSGHGVPAAMLSVTLSMMLTPDATHGSPFSRYNPATGDIEVLSPGDAIRELNTRFRPKDDRYFTMVYGLYDTGASLLRLAQAGHPGPIKIEPGGGLQILGTGGMPIGIWDDIDFDCFETSFVPGDRLLLYSDGVTECMNSEGQLFGETRLLDYLRGHAERPLGDMLEGLLGEIEVWRCGGDVRDDVSLLAIEMT